LTKYSKTNPRPIQALIPSPYSKQQSLKMSATPKFFTSIVFSNFEDKNIERGLDIDALLATVPTGLETAHTLKKWKRLTQSANQRLANARAKYAADRSAANANEFSRISIEVISIPSSLDVCLRMAKASDETNKRRSEAKRVYKAARSAAYGAYYAALNETNGWYRADKGRQSDEGDYELEITSIEKYLKYQLEDAEDLYSRARLRAFVICEGPID
jgi:hypothetical protein